MDSDSDFGFGGKGDDDASFTPSLEEEQQQQDENIVPATVTPTTQKKWRRFSLQEKLCILRNLRRRTHNGSSQATACRALNVHEKQLIEWKKQFQNLMESSNNKSSYERKDSRVGYRCKIGSNRRMHKKCMEAWRLQLVSRSQQQQYINTLYINACSIFLLYFFYIWDNIIV